MSEPLAQLETHGRFSYDGATFSRDGSVTKGRHTFRLAGGDMYVRFRPFTLLISSSAKAQFDQKLFGATAIRISTHYDMDVLLALIKDVYKTEVRVERPPGGDILDQLGDLDEL